MSASDILPDASNITIEAISPNRGPEMARYGFTVTGAVAIAGLASNLLSITPIHNIALVYYGIQLTLAVSLFVLSFTQWFRARWQGIVLGAGILLLTAITV